MAGSFGNTECRRDLAAVGIIAAIWVLMIVIADPSGDFPLNDDWCYALTVEHLVRDGNFQMVSVVTMSLVTQVIWGALFSLAFGFSYFTLRVSTMAAGLGGLIGTYLLLRELGASRRLALVGALVLAVNPIYFGLSNTFMTDVPFYALSVFAVYAFVRALNHRSVRAYAASIVLAILAVLLRQSGLALPIAFGVGYLVQSGARLRGVWRAGLPLILAAGTLIAYQSWLRATGNLSDLYGLQTRMMSEFLESGLARAASEVYTLSLTAVAYLGLFLFPLLAPISVSRWKSCPSISRVAGLAALAVTIRILVHSFGWEGGMPLNMTLGSIITPFGMGPLTLSDIPFAAQADLSPLPGLFWASVTAISAFGAGLLLLDVGSAVKMLCRRCKVSSATDKPVLAAMLAGAVVSLAPIATLFRHAYFDRYFLAPMLFLIALVTVVGRQFVLTRRQTAIALIIVVLGASYSVCTTHDYLAWNRTRWDVIHGLIAYQQIPPTDIDGGYEYNGLYDYDSRVAEGWWRVIDSEYAVTFAPVEGYDVLDTYLSGCWLPYGARRICVVKAPH